jgi:Sulfotransferase family
MNLLIALTDWLPRTLIKHLRSMIRPFGIQKYVAAETRETWVRALRRKNFDAEARNAVAGHAANLDDIIAFFCSTCVPCRAPLVLISQVQRSGGTLLSQLFDGHPAIAAHPHELKIGYPTSEDWPPADPKLGPDRNFQILFEARTMRLMRGGYTKGERDPERHAFLLVPRVHHAVFKTLFEQARPATPREVLDLYFTSYFTAWLNYQGNLDTKRWITTFAPRLANSERAVESFFETYPDGRLIQLIRNPKSWYPSAKRHRNRELEIVSPSAVLEMWRISGNAILRNKARFGDKVLILRFEDLVGRTEEMMRCLAGSLDFEYSPILSQPTFNGRPTRANSSFAVRSHGILEDPLMRASTLSESESELIERRYSDLYGEISARAIGTTS